MQTCIRISAMDWDNARVFLAIYRRGTLRGAAAELKSTKPRPAVAAATSRPGQFAACRPPVRGDGEPEGLRDPWSRQQGAQVCGALVYRRTGRGWTENCSCAFRN